MIRMMQRDESDVGNTHDFKSIVLLPIKGATVRLLDGFSYLQPGRSDPYLVTACELPLTMMSQQQPRYCKRSRNALIAPLSLTNALPKLEHGGA
jgi:hypothetical protein